MRSRAVTVTVPLLCRCFRLALNARRPHRQSALLPSSRRLKLTVERKGVGVALGELLEWMGGLMMMMALGGLLCLKTHLTLGYNAACVVIKCVSVSRSQAGYTLEVG